MFQFSNGWSRPVSLKQFINVKNKRSSKKRINHLKSSFQMIWDHRFLFCCEITFIGTYAITKAETIPTFFHHSKSQSCTVGRIWYPDLSGFWMVEKRLGCKQSRFWMVRFQIRSNWIPLLRRKATKPYKSNIIYKLIQVYSLLVYSFTCVTGL